MIHDPLTSPLLVPAALRIGILLVAGALLVLVAERRRLRRPRQLGDSVLVRRVLSWAVMAPAFVASALCGGVLSLAGVVFLTVQALREFAHVVGLSRPQARLLTALGVCAVVVAALAPGMFGFLPLAGFVVLTLATVLRGEVEGAWRDLTAALFGYVWLPLMLAFLALIGRSGVHGPGVVLALGVSVALSDVAAFCAGSLVGGRKLAPRISPNKTVAGAVGNLAGSVAGVALMSFALPTSWPSWVIAALPVAIAGACVAGDLLESLVKRSFAVKDAGTLLPGFGGLLDRIDSLLLALPVTYAVMTLAG